jgi:hypothetical protein
VTNRRTLPTRVAAALDVALDVALSLAVMLAAAAPASAQQPAIPRSQLGSVMQNVAGTQIEIVYRRPVARGRELFGALVPYGRVWTPSADSAARITLSHDVEVNGQPLAAGSYSIWAIPGAEEWTVIFNGVPKVFHLSYPSGRDVLRLQAIPNTGEHVETLTFAVPLADADSALVQLRWGTTVVPLAIKARTP